MTTPAPFGWSCRYADRSLCGLLDAADLPAAVVEAEGHAEGPCVVVVQRWAGGAWEPIAAWDFGGCVQGELEMLLVKAEMADKERER